MQKDDPSSLTRPEASDAEQEAWESWGRRWGVELGKEEEGDKGKGSEPEITEWRGDESAKGRGTRRRNDRVEVKTTAQQQDQNEEPWRIPVKNRAVVLQEVGEGGRARRPPARGGGGGRGAEGGPKAARGWGDGDAKAVGGTVGGTGGLGPREEEGVQMRPGSARPAVASEAQGVRPSPRSALPGAPSWLAPAPQGTRGGALWPLAPGAARGPALTCGRAGGGAGGTCNGARLPGYRASSGFSSQPHSTLR